MLSHKETAPRLVLSPAVDYTFFFVFIFGKLAEISYLLFLDLFCAN
jgi:hypothetical protein